MFPFGRVLRISDQFAIRKLLVALLICLATLNPSRAATQTLPSGFPTSVSWKSHLAQDLMRFWTVPAALGSPIGNFPSVRCNPGSRINYSMPCLETSGYFQQRRTTIVTLSRQTYGYCMAFNMTGNPDYLRYAEAGVKYIRNNAIDRTNGGFHTYRDDISGLWENTPKLRTAQELAYGLLGLSCYHYITRDPAVYADVLNIKNYIFSKYKNSSLGLLQWQLEDGNGSLAQDKYLVAQLDQLPYLLMMYRDLKPADRAVWKQDISGIADSILAQFYNETEQLFFTRGDTAAQRDLNQTGTDFGHNAKILWNFAAIGRLTGRNDLATIANARSPKLLQRAFMIGPGTWASGLHAGGTVDRQKTWWVHAELDQLIGTMAMRNLAHAKIAKRSYSYWFKYFVDRQFGEVWNSIEANSNYPTGIYPKAWFWKSAFHSVEHAYFGYLSTLQLEHKPVTLYFAFKKPVPAITVQPSIFQGTLKTLTSSPNGASGRIYRATFSKIAF